MRQIDGWESDVVKKNRESADFAAKIVEKRKKRSETNLKLQKAEQEAQKKLEKQQAKVINDYEQRIDELRKQITESIVLSTKNEKKQKLWNMIYSYLTLLKIKKSLWTNLYQNFANLDVQYGMTQQS